MRRLPIAAILSVSRSKAPAGRSRRGFHPDRAQAISRRWRPSCIPPARAFITININADNSRALLINYCCSLFKRSFEASSQLFSLISLNTTIITSVQLISYIILACTNAWENIRSISNPRCCLQLYGQFFSLNFLWPEKKTMNKKSRS